MPRVEYDESFRRAFPSLSETAKSDMTQIGQRLSTNAYYLPWEDAELEGVELDRPYNGERFEDGDGAVCWKQEDWEDWKLSWNFEFQDSATVRVENIVLHLHREPTHLATLTEVYVPGQPVSAKILRTLHGLRVW